MAFHHNSLAKITPTKSFSVAPMMAHTNKHFLFFWSLISQRATLYTEMVTVDEILQSINHTSELHKLLDYSQREQPVILQLGGRNPNTLAEATRWIQY